MPLSVPGMVKPKFHYADLHQSFLAWKVVVTNQQQSLRQTRLCCGNGIWSVTEHWESWQQKLQTLSRTQLMKVHDLNHKSQQHHFCRRLS